MKRTTQAPNSVYQTRSHHIYRAPQRREDPAPHQCAVNVAVLDSISARSLANVAALLPCWSMISLAARKMSGSSIIATRVQFKNLTATTRQESAHRAPDRNSRVHRDEWGFLAL